MTSAFTIVSGFLEPDDSASEHGPNLTFPGFLIGLLEEEFSLGNHFLKQQPDG
jgi:hypothetical protein